MQRNRFNADRILVDDNIVVVVSLGGHDSIEAVECKDGVPRVVLKDSTHNGIQLMSEWDKVAITLTAERKKAVKVLKADWNGLEAPK